MHFWTDPDISPIEVPDEDVAGAFFESIYAAPPFDQCPLEEALIVFLATYRGGAAWALADFKRIEWIIIKVNRQAARILGERMKSA